MEHNILLIQKQNKKGVYAAYKISSIQVAKQLYFIYNP